MTPSAPGLAIRLAMDAVSPSLTSVVALAVTVPGPDSLQIPALSWPGFRATSTNGFSLL
jgi:hypothetical protein